MIIDLTKLTSAPWEASDCDVIGPHGWAGTFHIYDEGGHNEDEAAFIALARNDLDVKLRRGWHTEKCTDADQWLVPQLVTYLCGMRDDAPFHTLTAAMYQNGHDVGLLTKADEWYRANCETAEELANGEMKR